MAPPQNVYTRTVVDYHFLESLKWVTSTKPVRDGWIMLTLKVAKGLSGMSYHSDGWHS